MREIVVVHLLIRRRHLTLSLSLFFFCLHTVLDPAMRRPGRLDREIEINVPNLSSRLQILQVHSKKLPLHQDINLHI